MRTKPKRIVKPPSLRLTMSDATIERVAVMLAWGDAEWQMRDKYKKQARAFIEAARALVVRSTA